MTKPTSQPLDTLHSGPHKIDPDVGKRFLLILGLGVNLALMAFALWPTAWLVLHYAGRAHTPGQWVLLILAAVMVFNYAYLVALLIARLLTPYPKPGHYPIPAGGTVSPVLLVFMLNVLLLKARREPPWAMMFSAVLSDVPPLGRIFRRTFGPRTTSCTLGDTVLFLDPYLLEAGKNVQFGYDCVITGHHFDNRGMVIAKVTIGDGAVIGGMSVIMAGTEIGHHAVVGLRAVVRPFTKIGPYEYWDGNPAQKIKDLRPTPDKPQP